MNFPRNIARLDLVLDLVFRHIVARKVLLNSYWCLITLLNPKKKKNHFKSTTESVNRETTYFSINWELLHLLVYWKKTRQNSMPKFWSKMHSSNEFNFPTENWKLGRCLVPLLLWASSPTYESFCPMPTMTPWCLGRPTMEGNTARGASSPAKPALHIPEPLSTTRAATSSSHILD